MSDPNILVQTIYAELLERCATDAFDQAFEGDGDFVAKTIKGRRYWYFQTTTGKGRVQKYVGPETPALLARITNHRQSRRGEKERRTIVSTLVRSFRMPRPIPQIGEIVSALADAGVFRLRAVLVGTTAYQTYPAMLGTPLPGATLQTGDIDIAQFANVSVAIEEQSPPVLETLRSVDKTFRAAPRSSGGKQATSYVAANRMRVDFLAPNRGRETDHATALPALGTGAEPLRFLDFLIHDPEQAVLLHAGGILVNVPNPARYAIHKLIISQRRKVGSAKQDKDIRQAHSLLDVLLGKRPDEFVRSWDEASGRGKVWKQLLIEGFDQLPYPVRDEVLKTLHQPRAIVPGFDIEFSDNPAAWVQASIGHDVSFTGKTRAGTIECRIQDLALADHFGSSDDADREKCQLAFRRHRARIEAMVRLKFLHWPIEQARVVRITTDDVPRLIHDLESASPRNR